MFRLWLGRFTLVLAEADYRSAPRVVDVRPRYRWLNVMVPAWGCPHSVCVQFATREP